jgi:hypothetical protein
MPTKRPCTVWCNSWVQVQQPQRNARAARVGLLAESKVEVTDNGTRGIGGRRRPAAADRTIAPICGPSSCVWRGLFAHVDDDRLRRGDRSDMRAGDDDRTTWRACGHCAEKHESDLRKVCSSGEQVERFCKSTKPVIGGTAALTSCSAFPSSPVTWVSWGAPNSRTTLLCRTRTGRHASRTSFGSRTGKTGTSTPPIMAASDLVSALCQRRSTPPDGSSSLYLHVYRVRVTLASSPPCKYAACQP